MKFNKEAEEPLAIDMTPLVDCIFAIILFLLVAASFVEGMQQDLPINLPTQSKRLNVKASPPRPIVVNVRNLGSVPEYRIAGVGKAMNINELESELSKARFNPAAGIGGDVSVVIRGDRNCKWEQIAAVLARCANVGIAKVSAAVSIDETKRD